MEMKKEIYHNHTFYTINNEKGLEVTFCNYGASVYEVKYKGRTVSYHEDSYEDFLKSNKYCGKTLGRVAGRIINGLMMIDDKSYQLETNEGNNTLHGGIHSLSYQDFETSVNETSDAYNIVFKYTSPDGECGFPHEVRFIIVYSVSKNENKFSIHYHANASGLTPVNLSPHMYWRLGGNNILDHQLKIDADEVTIIDNELIIIGKEKVNKMYDFRNEKKVGLDIKEVAKSNPRANGYDCGFILKKSNQPQISLSNDGIRLNINTDMNMAIVYSNCYGTNHMMKSYGLDNQYCGIAIEPQMYAPRFKDKLIDENHPFDHYASFHLEDF